MPPDKKRMAKLFWSKKRDEELLLICLENDRKKHNPLVLDAVREVVQERGLRIPTRASDEGRRLLHAIRESLVTRDARKSGLLKAKRLNHAFGVGLVFWGLIGFQLGESGVPHAYYATLGVCALILLGWHICLRRIKKKHQLEHRDDLAKI